ncbi:stage III sporulation protein SpoIIIAB [Priestia taiwanensis]|uniref:Stage III sporulation protein SpoAB n=1 Tax=Priestia taiwanensis TaxID=1347902 RepID=A0A917AHP2_9BACI|nr:stage III sporulation protein SpoIIIAB [Priestia taiwanensis]MBM7361390.1 stage III sporulation protein AB [Priestia taiwanensis]GGE53779.1 stage III sporulation protein SpoAB [Priestia taiwanensis]
MVKLIGAILIVAVTTWIGFELAKKYSDRPKQLRQLKAALQSLEAEIMYGHTPLYEAMESIAHLSKAPLSVFFQSFSKRLQEGASSVKDAWKSSLDEVWPQTALRKEEYEILRQFGETLGQHDRESQQKYIKLAIHHLEKEEKDARDNQHKYEKMMRSLGFLLGLLLIILLV